MKRSLLHRIPIASDVLFRGHSTENLKMSTIMDKIKLISDLGTAIARHRADNKLSAVDVAAGGPQPHGAAQAGARAGRDGVVAAGHSGRNGPVHQP